MGGVNRRHGNLDEGGGHEWPWKAEDERKGEPQGECRQRQAAARGRGGQGAAQFPATEPGRWVLPPSGAQESLHPPSDPLFCPGQPGRSLLLAATGWPSLLLVPPAIIHGQPTRSGSLLPSSWRNSEHTATWSRPGLMTEDEHKRGGDQLSAAASAETGRRARVLTPAGGPSPGQPQVGPESCPGPGHLLNLTRYQHTLQEDREARRGGLRTLSAQQTPGSLLFSAVSPYKQEKACVSAQDT